MKPWKRRINILLLCLRLLAGLAAGTAAIATVGAVSNSATHLRTSYSDSNHLDLSISGSALTISGELLIDGLQQVKIQAGSASQIVDTAPAAMW